MTDKNDILKKEAGEEHKLFILGRKTMNLTGVLDVVSFDDCGAILKTDMGTLAVDGEGLHVEKLDLSNGSVIIDGKINGVFYSEAGGAKGNKKRLFK